MSEDDKDDKITKEDLKEMPDNKVIDLGYCPDCYSKLVNRGGCTECPNGCLFLCG